MERDESPFVSGWLVLPHWRTGLHTYVCTRVLPRYSTRHKGSNMSLNPVNAQEEKKPGRIRKLRKTRFISNCEREREKRKGNFSPKRTESWSSICFFVASLPRISPARGARMSRIGGTNVGKKRKKGAERIKRKKRRTGRRRGRDFHPLFRTAF